MKPSSNSMKEGEMTDNGKVIMNTEEILETIWKDSLLQ